MRIGFVYDISENVFASAEAGLLNELATELFSPSQANAIISALKGLGHETILIDGAREFIAQIHEYKQRVDLVFNESKGLFGPDRKMAVPAMCRIYGIPCLGSDAYTAMLCRNKWHTTAITALCGIAIPVSALATSSADIAGSEWNKFPAIIKPNHESASIGLDESSIAYDIGSIEERVEYIVDKYRQAAIVQEFVQGRELQVSLIGTRSPELVGVTEVCLSCAAEREHKFITNEDWKEDRVDFQPCDKRDLPRDLIQTAINIYKSLGIRDYGRIDFIATAEQKAYFLEAATHPHITPGNSFVVAAQRRGWSFEAMISAIISAALHRESLAQSPQNSRSMT
jgi:D-alanine-D-alanine ligase